MRAHDHHDQDGHDHHSTSGPYHHHGPVAPGDRRYLVAIGLSLTIVAVETIGGFLANSTALVADAGHVLSDVLGLALAGGATWLAARPASGRRTYGFGKATVLAALANGVVLIFVSGGIALEAVNRLLKPEGVGSLLVMATAGVGVIINSIGATVSYNLDPFGSIRRQKESLEATAEAQARELDAAYLTLTGQVVAQAFTIADANLQIDELNEVVANDQSDLDAVKRSHAAGGASDADVAGVESLLSQDQSLIPGQHQRLEAARHALAILLGRAPADWTAPDFTARSFTMPETLPVSLPSALVRNRPDILEAEARLHAAVANVGVATANLYPSINLTATLEQDALTPQALFSPTSTGWTLMAGLTTPIFHSGELKAKQREAQANARVALAAYELTVLQAFGQVADVLSSIAHDNQAYGAQMRALDAAQARVTMERRGYALGGVSELELVDAERDWARTRLAVTQQSYSRAGDAALLLLATADVPPGAAAGAKGP